MKLKQAIEQTPLLVGVGIDSKLLQTPLIASIQNFQTWQPHNAYKFFVSCKGPGVYDLTKRDRFLNALPPETRFRAGPLVWRYQWAGFLSRVPTKTERWLYLQKWLEALLKPEPWAIDVVNEVVSPSGEVLKKLERFLGVDWVYRLFSLVKEICPTSKLFVCQNQLRNDAIWETVEKMVLHLRDRGIEAHVSMQLHCTLKAVPSYNKVIRRRFDQFKNLCDIHASECVLWIWRETHGRIIPGLKLKPLQQATYVKWLKFAEEYGVEQLAFWCPVDGYGWEYLYPDELGIFSPAGEWWSS